MIHNLSMREAVWERSLLIPEEAMSVWTLRGAQAADLGQGTVDFTWRIDETWREADVFRRVGRDAADDPTLTEFLHDRARRQTSDFEADDPGREVLRHRCLDRDMRHGG